MRRFPPNLLAAGLLVVGLLAGGCGGSGDNEPGAAATSSTTSAPTTTAPSTAASSTTTTLDTSPRTTLVVESDPDTLAATIADAERELRSPDLTDAAARQSAMLAQEAYRAISIQPELTEAVVAAVPADLRDAVRANAEATTELRRLTKPAKALPAWRIVAPAPADELYGYYRAAETEFGVPWAYLAAIHLVETRMGRIRGTSTAGARGPMQFIPSTWEAFGEGDIESNRDSIRAAARYLKHNGAPRKMANALYNYNHSDRYVRAVTLHAEVMLANEQAASSAGRSGGAPGAYRGYHQWQVWYRLPDGDVMLPEGWSNTG